MLNFSKKIILFIITLGMLLENSAFASETSKIYFSEDFSSYPTNSTPEKTVETQNCFVGENEEKNNKYLEMGGEASTFQAAFKSECNAKNYTVAFDIMAPEGDCDISITISDSSNTSIKPIVISGRTVKTYDNKSIGGISKDKFTGVAIVGDAKYKRYSIYINEKPVLNNWYSETFPIGAAGLTITGSCEKKSTVRVDNVHIYSASRILSLSEFPENEYNTDEYAVGEELAEEVGSKLHILTNFNQGWETKLKTSLQLYPNQNSIAVKTQNRNENNYLKLDKTTSSECFIQIIPSTTQPQPYEMFYFDMMSETLSPVTLLLVDGENQKDYSLSVAQGGTINFQGNSIGKINKTRWTNVIIGVNARQRKLSVWIDKTLVVDNASMLNKDFGNMSILRILLTGQNSELKIDNVIAHQGIEPSDFSSMLSGVVDENRVVYNLKEDLVAELLDGLNAVKPDTEYMYVNGERKKAAHEVYYEGDDLMLSKEDAQAILGSEIEVKSGKVIVNGKVIEEINKTEKNSLDYFCVNDIAWALGLTITNIDTGFVTVGNRTFEADTEDMLEVDATLTYDRPEKETIDELFTDVHPRIIINKQRLEQIKSDYKTNEIMKEWGDKIIANAESYMTLPGCPWPGDSVVSNPVGIQGQVRTVTKRVAELAMAYHLTGNSKYAQRTWIEMETACSYPHWSQEQRDLEPAEMSLALAIGYDWLYDWLSDEQKKEVEENIVNKELKCAYETYHQMRSAIDGWTTVINNHNSTCNGAVIMASCAIYDKYPELCNDLIFQALRCIESPFAWYYPAGGGWCESISYGQEVTKTISRLYNTLQNVFGTDFNFSKTPLLDQNGYFPVVASTALGGFSYNDGGSDSKTFPGTTFWLSDRYNKPELTELRLYELKENQAESGFVEDMIFYDTSIDGSNVSMPLDGYMKGLEMVSMRSDWSGSAASVVFESGENLMAQYHAHIDAGDFQLDMLGERFAEDAGVPYYYTGSDANDLKVGRWKYYGRRPEGHNTLIINPDETPGQDIYSSDKVECLVSKERGAYSITGLSSAYKDYANSVRRGFMLGDDRRSVTIRDEIDLKKDDSDVYWFMHIKNGEIKIENNEAILTKNGKSIKLKFVTNADSSEISVMDAVHLVKSVVPDKQDDTSTYKKVAIKLKASGKVYLQVKIIPVDDPCADNSIEDIALDDWKVPDGEIQAIPVLSDITVKGDGIDGFDSSTLGYKVTVPFGQEVMPLISANCTDDCAFTIENSECSISGVTKIKVYKKDNPDLYRTYFVTYEPDMSELSQYRYKPINITASDIPQPENPPASVQDENLNTRWAADGDGVWIMMDLGEIKPVDYIGLSFMNGDTRRAKYDLLISADSQNWETIFSGEASGKTNDIELTDKLEKNIRYIKVVGHGSNTGTWNSITELGTYKLN